MIDLQGMIDSDHLHAKRLDNKLILYQSYKRSLKSAIFKKHVTTILLAVLQSKMTGDKEVVYIYE